MFKIFRKTRKDLLGEGKTTRYFKYAIGEIVLVVIGILIALQINNQNDLRKERNKEVHYLSNIKNDLKINIVEMNKFIDARSNSIQAATRVLEHFEGKPITDTAAFNAEGFTVYDWQRFYQSNNTFQELVNSGNLGLISNDEIKNLLLDIEAQYTKIKSEEDHYRFDTETNLYEPLYALMDINTMIKSVEYYASKGQTGEETILPDDFFTQYLNNKNIKNGFTLTVYEYNVMNNQMAEMVKMSDQLILAIDNEINADTQ
ncbi:MAG: hypothetical protein IMF09_06255 [Proteobacteria bacterium]|nr:hypothetical protein [Pseudomonadota bacterium]